jgi:LysR family transcriptional regulator, carnitine catabolism transcriptional activator
MLIGNFNEWVPMNIDLHQLRSFVAVARLGNFTRAAERLNLSQPSLSLQIRQLEQELGLRLLDRSTRSVTLTRAGEDFLPTAARLLDDFQSAIGTVADLAARRRGRVAVAVLPSVAAELLPQAIALLRARHPDIVVSLRDDVAEHIPARVRSGEVDFGLGAIDGVDADLSGAPLITDELIAVLPRVHPLANGAKTTPLKATWRALAKHPFVAMSRDSSVRQLTEQAFARNGLVLEPAFEAKYMSTAIGLIAQGLGVGTLPSSAVSMVRQAGLAHAEIHRPVMKRRIGIITRRGRSLSPAAQALVGMLKTAANGDRKNPELVARAV